PALHPVDRARLHCATETGNRPLRRVRPAGWSGRPDAVVGDTGFEPVTSSVSGKRATAAPIARARWVRDSNPCIRLCRPLPRLSANPPGDDVRPAVSPAGGRRLRADDGTRTRDPHLGKVMLYQLSHIRMLTGRTEMRPACVEDSNPPLATTSNRSGRATVSCMSHSRAAAHRPVAQVRHAAHRAAAGTRRAGANGVGAGVAQFAGVRGEGVLDYADLSRAPDALDAGGWWALAGEFGGPVHAWRFARVEVGAEVDQGGRGGAEHDGGASLWSGPSRDLWSSSMDRSAYLHAVQATQAAIREGEVYQANICRMLSAPVPDRPDAAALAAVLDRGNPAPY